MSLNIEKKAENGVTFVLDGRLDTVTSPQLEKQLDETIENAASIVLDLEKLEYISSAGLRVLLKAQKAMKNEKSLKLKNVGDAVMEVLEITGFADFLDIEQ